jgi:hypothetical protein
MKRVRVVGMGLGTLLVACNSPITSPDAGQQLLRQSAAAANADQIRLTGAGHHVRVVGTLEELTTFSFSALTHSDGSATGQYQYNFQANGFAIHGPVTCVTRSGNQVWVGGIVDRVVTDNPAFEGLAGLEMWWRSVDNGEGAAASPDMTTGVGFGFAGSTITAASWCANQPALLPLRVVENGNIQVH